MGRLPKISLAIPPELLNQLDLFAVNHKMTRSEVIRRALVYYFTAVNEPRTREI